MSRPRIPPCRTCGGIRFSLRTWSSRARGKPRRLIRYCLDCAAAHARRQRAERPEINAAARAKWRSKNRQRMRDIRAAYVAAHYDEVRRKDRARKARMRERRRIERLECERRTA